MICSKCNKRAEPYYMRVGADRAYCRDCYFGVKEAQE